MIEVISVGNNTFYNCDCVTGSQSYLASASIDLMICDPPYGIRGDCLEQHYNRKEKYVLDGYVEVPQDQYPQFSIDWILEAERVLRPGGSIYIISGYSNLIHVLNALQKTKLVEVNHIIWKYNFGVYTKKKYVSSHYHILFCRKPGSKHTFNTFARYSDWEKSEAGRSLNYRDREDVWTINRKYKPGQRKNKNELPEELIIKLIQYSSHEQDVVCDFFLGSFSTAKVAIGLNRKTTGFELNQTAFKHQIKQIKKLTPGYILDQLPQPKKNRYFNQGKPITQTEIESITARFQELQSDGHTKKIAIERLSDEYGRGYWSLRKIINSK